MGARKMATDATTTMSPAEMAAELERLRALVDKAEQREEERQRKLRPIVGIIRIFALFLIALAIGMIVLEWTYGFKGHMASAANQFIMLGGVMSIVWSAFVPLTGRSYGIAAWRKAARGQPA